MSILWERIWGDDRTNNMICGAQNKMKMWDSMFKMKNFKMVAAELKNKCEPFWVGDPVRLHRLHTHKAGPEARQNLGFPENSAH